MRAKNREVNIFNMSLMDVLTGALGAFVFLMLSFVPYYNIVMQANLTPSESQKQKDALKKDNTDLKKQIEELERKNKELQEKVDDLIEKLKDAGKGDVTAEELAKLEEENNRLKKEIEELKDEIAKLKAENDDLRDEIAALEDKVDELKAKLVTALDEIDKLRAENEELKRRLATMTPGDPEAEQKLRIAQAQLFSKSRSVFIATTVSGEGRFEFLVRDPKGFWYDVRSDFPFGVKAMEFETAYGKDAQDQVERLESHRRGNSSFALMEGMLVSGEYLIGMRAASEQSAADPYSLQNLFGSPGPAKQPGAQQPSSSGPQARINLPLRFGLVAEALAQSAEDPRKRFAGPRQDSVDTASDAAYPRTAERRIISGIARINRGVLRTMISEMPTQSLPVNRWLSLIAKVEVHGPIVELRWFERLSEVGDTFSQEGGLIDGAERQELERKINATKIEPLIARPICSGGTADCDRTPDARGDITEADVDETFRDQIVLPNSKNPQKSKPSEKAEKKPIFEPVKNEANR